MFEPLTVSALTLHIQNLLRRDDPLQDVWVLGEIGSWRRYSSGHAYFTLKDPGARLAGVMWRSHLLQQPWLPQEGDQVLVHGYVDVYPDRGIYQLYADAIRPAGRGELYARFEALKARLAAEGLFDRERKRPLPERPARIGVVTSEEAAALRDVLRTLHQRWPLVEVVLFPTRVQGVDAPDQIVAALAEAGRFGREGAPTPGAPLEVILLVRGGGSLEDLWAFNDERVARAVAGSPVPVVTGVGHETDFTIVDFVADHRAPTPTAAAAAVVPDRADWIAQLRGRAQALLQEAQSHLRRERRQLQMLETRLRRAHPERALERHRQRLDEQTARLHRSMAYRLQRLQERLAGARGHLEALNPHQVLARGYSIVQKADGQVVVRPQQVHPGERLAVRAHGGTYTVLRP